MSISPPARPGQSKSFPALVAAGVLVVAAGVLLPRLLALSPSPDPSPAAVADPLPPPPALPTEPVAPPSDAPSLFAVVAKLVLGLAIVVGACIGVARWTNRNRTANTPGIMDAVACLAIDPRCAVHLVTAGGRRLLVGVDVTGVKAVLELPTR